MTNVITKKRSSLERNLAGGLVTCYMIAKKEVLGTKIKKKQCKFRFGQPAKPIIIEHFDYNSDESDYEPSDDESSGSEDDQDEQQPREDSQQREETEEDDLNQEILDLNLDEIMIDPTEDEIINGNNDPVAQKRPQRRPAIDYYVLNNNCGSRNNKKKV